MASRVDRLEVKFEATGDGQVKASLAGIAKGEKDVATGAREVQTAWASMDRVVGDTKYKRDGILAMAELARRQKVVAEQAKETAGAMDAQEAAGRRLQATLSRLGIGVGIAQLLIDAVKTAAAYQDMEVRVRAVARSQQAANDTWVLARAVANDLKLSVLEVGGAMVDLRTRGLVPTGEMLTAIANYSAVAGKSFEDTARIIADASNGNVDALSAFGITAEKVGDRIILTYNGVSTSVANDAGEIVAALNTIGTNDFADVAAQKAANLNGTWAGLRNTAGELADDVADLLAPAFRELNAAMSGNSNSLGAAAFFTTLSKGAKELVASLTGSKQAQADAIALAEQRADAEASLSGMTDKMTAAENRKTAAGEKANETGKKLVDQLKAQIPAYGEAASAQTLLTTQRIAAAMTDKVAQAELLALGKALSDAQAKQEAETKATRDGKKAKQETSAVLREFTDDYKRYMKEMVADEQAMLDGWREEAKLVADVEKELAKANITKADLLELELKLAAARASGGAPLETIDRLLGEIVAKEDELARGGGRSMKALAEAAQQLVDELDPAAAATRKLAEDQHLLDTAMANGTQVVGGYTAALAELQRRRQELAANNQPLALGLSWLTGESGEDSADMLKQFGEDFSRTIAQSAANGFKDAGPALEGWLKNMFGNVLESVVNNFVVQPLMQAANNLISGIIQQAAGAAVSNAAGSAVGGAAGQVAGGAAAGGATATATGAGVGAMAVPAMYAAVIAALAIMNQNFLEQGYKASATSFRDIVDGTLHGKPFASFAVGAIATDRLLQSLGVSETIASHLTGSSIWARFFGGQAKPEIDVRGGGANNFGDMSDVGIGAFGRVGVANYDTKGLKADEMLQGILALDDTLAQFLSRAERSTVTSAMEGFYVNNARNPADVLVARFNAVVAAVNPAWSSFLDGIEGIEDRVKSFAALRIIDEQVDSLSNVLDTLGQDTLAQLRAQLELLSDGVSDTAIKLSEAIASNDPEAIATAAAAATEAVVARYQTEIGLARELQSAFDAAKEKAYNLNIAIEQRIAGITGNNDVVAGMTAARRDELGEQVKLETDPNRALELLDQWIASVDQWLEQSTAAVRARYAEQLDALAAEAEAITRNAALAQQLREALAQADQQAYQLQLTLAQRIGGLTGDSSQAAALAFDRMGQLGGPSRRAESPTGSAEQALATLNEWIATVDQWLSASTAAVQERYNAQLQALSVERQAIEAAADARERELALVQQINDALGQAYQLQQTLAQRIAGLTGDSTGMASLAAGRMVQLRSQIDNAANAEQALAALNEWIATVDQWLSASTARINEALARQLALLDAQRTSIMDAANARAAGDAAAQSNADAINRLNERRRQREIAALQQQLELTQEWVSVMDAAQQLIDELTRSTANPLSGQGRLDALNASIAALQGGPQTADTAQQLIALLQERLNLVMNEGLMQRPSAEYLDLYNQTLAELARLQSLAGPQADQALILQQQIAALQQQTVTAVHSGTSTAVQLSAEEQAQLDAIAAEEARLRAEAQAALDALNAEALGYYQWAQGEAIRLEAQRHAELIAALTTGSNTIRYTPEEQARLEAIAKEQAAAQAAMQADLAAINAQALAYYQWAQGEAQRLDDLRRAEIIATLTNGSTTIQYTPEEQARLDQIAKEQAALQEAMRVELDAINAQALAYYTWARTTAAGLQQQQHDELVAQLEVLTGGTPLEQFIAERQALATDLLGDIRDDLRAFLDAIATPGGGGAGGNTGGGTGGTGGGGGGGGGGGDPVGADGNGAVVLNMTINANGLTAGEIGPLVQREMLASASMLRRELQRA